MLLNIVGVMSNVLCVYIFGSPNMCRPIKKFFCSLAAVDALSCVLCILNQSLELYFNALTSVSRLSMTIYLLSSLLRYLLCAVIRPYLTTSMSFVRYKNISNVSRLNAVVSVKSMEIVLLVTFSVSLVLFIPEMFNFRVISTPIYTCFLYHLNKSIRLNKYFTLYSLFRQSLPCFSMIILSFFIIQMMCSVRSHSVLLQNTRQRKALNKIIRAALVIAGIVFSSILVSISFIVEDIFGLSDTFHDDIAAHKLAHMSIDTFVTISSVLNIVLFCLQKDFRQELWKSCYCHLIFPEKRHVPKTRQKQNVPEASYSMRIVARNLSYSHCQ